VQREVRWTIILRYTKRFEIYLIFFQTGSGLHVQWTRCAFVTRCIKGNSKLLGHDAMFIFMVAENEMALVKRLVERKIESFENVVCNCNFVICTIKYTHTCALGTGFKLVGH